MVGKKSVVFFLCITQFSYPMLTLHKSIVQRALQSYAKKYHCTASNGTAHVPSSSVFIALPEGKKEELHLIIKDNIGIYWDNDSFVEEKIRNLWYENPSHKQAVLSELCDIVHEKNDLILRIHALHGTQKAPCLVWPMSFMFPSIALGSLVFAATAVAFDISLLLNYDCSTQWFESFGLGMSASLAAYAGLVFTGRLKNTIGKNLKKIGRRNTIEKNKESLQAIIDWHTKEQKARE